MNINKNSSPTTKSEVADVVFDALTTALFDRVSYINHAYSDFGLGGTTSTTNLDLSSRIIDSSGGVLMSPGKESKFRCQFYLKNPSKLVGYILSPAVFDSYDSSLIQGNLSPLRSYVGIKFVDSKIYLVAKEAGKSEVTRAVDLALTMYDATFTDTYSLEIEHNVGSTEIKINGVNYGTIATDLVGSVTSVKTFYPFFSPGISTDGTIVNIVSENVQFIQNKK